MTARSRTFSRARLGRTALASAFALATLGVYVWAAVEMAPVSSDPPEPAPSCLAVTLGESAWRATPGPVPTCITVAQAPAAVEVDSWWRPGHPRRTARSQVSVAPATGAEVATFPFKKETSENSTVAPPAPDAAFVKVSIVHTVRLSRTDPALKDLRSAKDLPDLTDFVQSAFGQIDTDGSSYYYGTYFHPPKLSSPGPDGSVLVTLTAIGYSQYLHSSPLIGLELTESDESDTSDPATSDPPFETYTVHVSLAGWTVAGVSGQIPATLRLGSLDLAGQTTTRIALISVEDVPSAEELSSYLGGGTLPPVAQAAAEQDPSDVVNAVLLGVTSLALALMLARALGRAWWRRRLNWILVAAFTVFALLWWNRWLDQELVGMSGQLLLAGIAVHHALRRLGPPRWSLSRWMPLASAIALLAGIVTAGWILVFTEGTATWAAASLLALVLALLFLPGRRAWALPSAALAALGLSVVLFLRAELLPDSFGYVVIVVVHLLWWAVLASGLAVSTGRWSVQDAFLCLAAMVALSAIFVSSPEQVGTAPLADFLPFALPIAVLVFLVIRLCRLGRSPDAIIKPEAYATSVLVLMTLYLAPTLGGVGISSLLAWAALAWLLSGPAALRAPSLVITSPPAHRSAIQAAIRRRFMQSAERDLFRTGRGRIASGEVSVTDYEEQRRSLEQAIADTNGAPIDPDLAFATTAGRPPWENGLIGAGVGLVLTLPLALVHQWPLGDNPFAILYACRTLLTMPAFGFVFGFFYPRVRGDQPLAKALNLLLAGVAVQISTKFTQFTGAELDTGEKFTLLAVVSGETALFAIGLGLFWEWRLMRLAEEPWAKIRSVRSIRALAAPLTAVLIAAATTVTTTLASGITDSFRPAPLPTISHSPTAPTGGPTPGPK
ncbi:hypothetical protein [Nonomuraea basaltis]|uniref:hypothetical protein n=1 Tax=Nonomuraea basaltis TaxID=2495887 RepID=UPI00110C60E6|nr:hypothetical protein [Nonomuraea basaltis]TMR98307.1 hypothetical protein EJK15_13215 [Nonomuraea basaltis]